MNIFINLPFEFLRKIVLFSFWYDINYIYYICDYPYNKRNMIMKYITIY